MNMSRSALKVITLLITFTLGIALVSMSAMFRYLRTYRTDFPAQSNLPNQNVNGLSTPHSETQSMTITNCSYYIPDQFGEGLGDDRDDSIEYTQNDSLTYLGYEVAKHVR